LKNKEYTKGSLLKQLRSRIVNNGNYEEGEQLKWVLETPYDIRDNAVRELVKNFKTNMKTGHKFELQYKSRKNSTSIQLRRRDFSKSPKNKTPRKNSNIRKIKVKTKCKTYCGFLSQLDIHDKNPINLEQWTHDPLINMNHNTFTLVIPYDLKRSESQVPQRIISIDPGVRTFLTGYCPDGNVYYVGNDDIGILRRLLYYKDKLQGKVALHQHRNKNRIRKALWSASARIKNLVDDCHKKTAHWLCENFDWIVLPRLNTNQFCRKKMSGYNKNSLKVWRHCSFIERLKMKLREYPNSHLIIPTEEYTSKTCGHCGNINIHLGCSRNYHCPSCDRELNRDVNGAFNILLKVLTEVSCERADAIGDRCLHGLS
jgi:transposase